MINVETADSLTTGSYIHSTEFILLHGLENSFPLAKTAPYVSKTDVRDFVDQYLHEELHPPQFIGNHHYPIITISA